MRVGAAPRRTIDRPSHPSTAAAASHARRLPLPPPHHRIAFLGYGWESDQRNWRSEFLYAVGEPLGPCVQTGTVFTREWTHGTARLDCASFDAVVPAA
jgi:hypothetical protein